MGVERERASVCNAQATLELRYHIGCPINSSS